MRTTFVETLSEMARHNERIMCVIGDTGFSVFEEFEKEFGKRFVNVGIAEQNFVSFGAGLAAMGMKPYLYNVASFMTLRATEQIMLDVCYQENPVVLVGVGGGFAYGTSGPTHHALHDVAMMSEMPNMTVVCPGDPIEMKAIIRESELYDKPMYIRIGRSVNPVVHSTEGTIKIGKAISIKEGNDGVLFVSGVMLATAVEVVEKLTKYGISLSLYSIPTIKPIDAEVVLASSISLKNVFTLEEHSIYGGLGDTIGRVLIDNGVMPRILKKYAVADEFAQFTGTRDYLNNYYGLSPQSLIRNIRSIYDKM